KVNAKFSSFVVVGLGCPESRESNSGIAKSVFIAIRCAPSGAPSLSVQMRKGARKEQSMKWSSFKRNFAVVLILGLAILGLVVSSVNAQTGTTSLHGTVTDQTHSAIVGARVTIINAQ